MKYAPLLVLLVLLSCVTIPPPNPSPSPVPDCAGIWTGLTSQGYDIALAVADATVVQIWITVDVRSPEWVHTAEFPNGYYVAAPIEDGRFTAVILTEDGFRAEVTGTITGETMEGAISASYVHPVMGGRSTAQATFQATRALAPSGQSGG